ncbi:hypothetical protein IQ218_02315 [Synechocystis salina LEGE 06099]|uniref:tetratricopeptide repeat protein n=1 Tax=Synechocystis salina TaxID=945780 RepID=UPI001881314B|nr:tetratricopeptide repeat protein [Synechocystis salina]MBE9202513.1 hypothetical protein [Synechocystis salina LEGE 06099]
MNLLDQVQKLVNSAKYLELVSILEEKIAYHPEELNYRWFMGLAYLLQEDQETAIETWLVPFLTNETNDVEQLTVELMEFLEEQVKEAIKNEQLGQAKVIYDAIFLINSEYNHPQLREQLFSALTVIANGLKKSEHYDLAVDVFNEILDLEPQQDPILRSIACCYCQIEYLDQAKESINRAIEINPESPENHYILGMIFEKQAKVNEAIIAYKLSIQQNNSYLNAYENLINLLKKQNKIDEAITLCESGLSLIPSSSTLHNLLGDCYQSVGQIKKSHLRLGYAAYKSINSRDFAVALHHFEKYFSESNQERIQEFSFYDALANCYRMCNQTESAIEVLERTLKFYPIKKLEINRLNQVLLPILYNNQKEIDFYRHRFSQLLNSLINNTKLITQDHIDDAIQSIYIRTNFWLSYQNRNDLYIQKNMVII